MWIIKLLDRYNQYVDQEFLDGWNGTAVRDNARRFTKQEAKDFMEKYSIRGSIIPA